MRFSLFVTAGQRQEEERGETQAPFLRKAVFQPCFARNPHHWFTICTLHLLIQASFGWSHLFLLLVQKRCVGWDTGSVLTSFVLHFAILILDKNVNYKRVKQRQSLVQFCLCEFPLQSN